MHVNAHQSTAVQTIIAMTAAASSLRLHQAAPLTTTVAMMVAMKVVATKEGVAQITAR